MTLSRFDLAAGILILILIAISVYNHWKSGQADLGRPQSLGVKELIEEVKSELVKTEENRIATDQPSLFEIKDFDLEVKFVVSEQRTGSGKLEFKVATVGGDASVSSERVQTIRLHMTATPPKKGESEASVPPSNEEKVVTFDPAPPKKK